ncbi:MAG: AAA family ATPase, partial [Victivallales bacterium]|nr:AAA family ATPase [Victivallales bacterium]
ILFLDEIDGLVQDRSNSDYSWEVTRVNELLHQMENFNGVMVGTTNFLQNLDPAIMRRFTFKLQFNYLDDRGKRLFFERMFKSQLTDEELVRLNAIKNLAPGDFRTVRQSLLYYGCDVTNAQRLAALEIESAAKSGKAFTSRERIGF